MCMQTPIPVFPLHISTPYVFFQYQCKTIANLKFLMRKYWGVGAFFESKKLKEECTILEYERGPESIEDDLWEKKGVVLW